MDRQDLSIAQSARKISELDELSSVSGSECIAVDGHDGISYRIALSSIAGQVYDQAESMLSLGTAAYTQTGDYSPAAHDHPYSDFWYFSSYGPDSGNKDVQAVKIGEFVVKKPNQDANSLPVYVPVFGGEIDTSESDPCVGEIKMLGIQNFYRWITEYKKYRLATYKNGKVNIDIFDESFDGWVIPNGTTFTGIQQGRFKAACAAYGSNYSETDTEFTVPNLSGFFKCRGSNEQSEQPLAHVLHNNVLREHTHALGVVEGESVSNKTAQIQSFILKGTNSPGNITSGRIHRYTTHSGMVVQEKDFRQADSWYYDEEKQAYKFKCSAFGIDHWGYLDSGALSVVSLQSSSGSAQIQLKANGQTEQFEQFPNYQDVPALIYIGKNI